MFDGLTRRRPAGALVASLLGALVVAGCGAKKSESSGTTSGGGAAAGTTDAGATTAASSGTSKPCGKVTINEASWVGSSANVYVVKNLLETKLKCNVSITKIAEIPVFQAMSDGKVDVVLEDWQHTPEYQKYEKQLGTVVDVGSNGVVGHIGWYTPKYVVDEHPELATWEGLKTQWSLFKSPEAGGKGMLLDGDPSYVTNDEPLVKNLGLNLKVVYAGGEASQITQVRQAYKSKKPILFYWYTPQWLNAELELAEVKLPERTEGCDADAKKVKCAYPDYDLRKLASKKFVDSGSPAVDVVKKFKWTADDQNAVAVMIARDKMKPDEAAAKWVQENTDKVSAWLPAAS